MNYSFKLVPYERGCKASLYSVLLEGEAESEFNKFLADPEVSIHPKLGELLVQIDEIINRYGCQERFFREESSYLDVVAALWKGNLRLYCCRYGNLILILGSGGIKTTRTYQEDAKLDESVELMATVSRLVDERIRTGELSISGNTLKGNLIFSVED